MLQQKCRQLFDVRPVKVIYSHVQYVETGTAAKNGFLVPDERELRGSYCRTEASAGAFETL